MQTDDEREKTEIEKRERMKKEHWKNMEVGVDDSVFTWFEAAAPPH